jgi:hypothetical protein
MTAKKNSRLTTKISSFQTKAYDSKSQDLRKLMTGLTYVVVTEMNAAQIFTSALAMIQRNLLPDCYPKTKEENKLNISHPLPHEKGKKRKDCTLLHKVEI